MLDTVTDADAAAGDDFRAWSRLSRFESRGSLPSLLRRITTNALRRRVGPGGSPRLLGVAAVDRGGCALMSHADAELAASSAQSAVR
jgi:hypothetical protein